MKLQTLLNSIPALSGHNISADFDVNLITSNSQNVKPGAIFIAINGVERDGHEYIDDAIRRGAAFLITEKKTDTSLPVPGIQVPCARTIEALLSAKFFDEPSRSVKTIGITGTNGKTTIAFLLAHILRRSAKVGLLSTIYYDTGYHRIEAQQTTPPPYDVQQYIAAMRTNQCEYCVMEVSSHALSQKRVEGIEFDGAIFTNLTQDHLDYHLTIEKYFAEKRLLFSCHRPHVSIINADDPHGMAIINTVEHTDLITYGITTSAHVQATNIQSDMNGLRFCIQYCDSEIPIRSSLVCRHNIYNIMAAFAYAVNVGLDPSRVAEAIADFPGVKGRLEGIDCGQPFSVFVDYAHTPDAFNNVLTSMREMNAKRIISVFGCGGDRDRGKRPQMGRRAAEYSDYVILTNDNPRYEDEDSILQDIEAGVQEVPGVEYIIIPERDVAIKTALSAARENDIVLILGKGHEEYILRNGEKTHFSDRECAETYFNTITSAQNKGGN